VVVCAQAIPPHSWERTMCNEDMQRQMEFIVERQAWMTAHIQQFEEHRIRDEPRGLRSRSLSFS
jgi:hypothetical protein